MNKVTNIIISAHNDKEDDSLVIQLVEIAGILVYQGTIERSLAEVLDEAKGEEDNEIRD